MTSVLRSPLFGAEVCRVELMQLRQGQQDSIAVTDWVYVILPSISECSLLVDGRKILFYCMFTL